MRIRGEVYWEWADPELHFRNYDERLTCGYLINIQVRTSKQNVTQLFMGVYGETGVMLLEEHFPDCRSQTMTKAMVWAQQRAHDWVNEQCRPAPPVGPEPPSRRGARRAE